MVMPVGKEVADYPVGGVSRSGNYSSQWGSLTQGPPRVFCCGGISACLSVAYLLAIPSALLPHSSTLQEASRSWTRGTGLPWFGALLWLPPTPPPPPWPWPWPWDFCKKLTLPEEHLISHLNLEGRLHNCLLSLASACKSSSLFHLRINSTHMQMLNSRVWPALGSAAGQQAGGHLAGEFSAPVFNLAGLSCSHFGYRKCMWHLPRQHRCFCKTNFHCALTGRRHGEIRERSLPWSVGPSWNSLSCAVFAYPWDVHPLWPRPLSSIPGDPLTTRWQLLRVRHWLKFLFVSATTENQDANL